MTNKRLSSHSWISAYCKYLELEGIPYYVLRKGNLISGAILVKVTMSRDSAVLYHSILDMSGKSIWDTLCQGNHDEIDKNLEKQISFDKDLWILEVEEKGGHGLLERPYLERG